MSYTSLSFFRLYFKSHNNLRNRQGKITILVSFFPRLHLQIRSLNVSITHSLLYLHNNYSTFKYQVKMSFLECPIP